MNGPTSIGLNDRLRDKWEKESAPLDLRDYFAARVTISTVTAINSLDMQRFRDPDTGGVSLKQIMDEKARLAYEYADAMIVARSAK